MRTTKDGNGSLTLHCFSPAVILFTCVVETALAIYSAFWYRASRFGRLATLFFLLLAGFQFSELMICRGADPNVWARFGFVCTAILPAIGVEFVSIITKRGLPTRFFYGMAGVFCLILIMKNGLFTSSACTGRFVEFNLGWPLLTWSYMLYYLLTLFYGIGVLWEAYMQKRGHQATVFWMLIGYAIFMLPTMVVYIVAPFMREGFPSMLCGFALLLAFVLAFKVLPLVGAKRRS